MNLDETDLLSAGHRVRGAELPEITRPMRSRSMPGHAMASSAAPAPSSAFV